MLRKEVSNGYSNGNGEVEISLQSLTPREQLWVNLEKIPSSLQPAEDYFKIFKPGDSVIDIGSGTGEKSKRMADKYGVHVLGIDINKMGLEIAKKSYADPNVKFRYMNGSELKFPEDTFGHATMIGVIGGVEPEERRKILGKAFNVVRPGGTLMMTEFRLNSENPEKVQKYLEDKELTGEWGGKVIWEDGKKNGKKILELRHFTDKELVDLLLDVGCVEIHSILSYGRSRGLGDHIEEERAQYTTWGFKPQESEN
jgi:ubiquinone/menaquinone biosynthesis C-methylase UbiE